jgi:hypothetical protein|tara:strand:+ start:94 stop:333 length:240 start_codon:yes stop_codon:yes gene_type:complete
MAIDEKTLLAERKVLEEDFNTTKDRIVQVEKDLGNMKSNLNAVYGAIQQIDKLLVLTRKDGEKKPMPAEKEKALNLAIK